MPTLDFLRGFDAAARHLNFTHAARELFLTQSALSRQILALEGQLGVALFERTPKQLRLTDAGRVLHAVAARMLADVSQAMQQIREDTARRAITVSTSVSFAALWLLPRLPRFRERHPDIDVHIAGDNRMVELTTQSPDLAVRYCPPEAAPAGALRLFGERLQPVCSPALARHHRRPLKEPADLAHHVLLHFEDVQARYPWLQWPQWLASAGMTRLDAAGALRFSHYDMVIRAALAGQGVALGRSPLVDDLLDRGVLVAPLGEPVSTARAYFIVRAAKTQRRAQSQAFMDWMVEQARDAETSRT